MVVGYSFLHPFTRECTSIFSKSISSKYFASKKILGVILHFYILLVILFSQLCKHISCWLWLLLTHFPNLLHFGIFSFCSCLIFFQLLEEYVLIMVCFIFRGWILCSLFLYLAFIDDLGKPILIYGYIYLCILLDFAYSEFLEYMVIFMECFGL